MRFQYFVALIAFFYVFPSWASESFIVEDIRVEGIQRTEAGTVFSYLPIKVGEVLDAEKATEAIKALYATGFFKDVKLKNENNILIVEVIERPAIAQISINGAKEFEKDKLLEGLKQAGISESRIFSRSLLERAELELKRQYISRGKYAVKITTTSTPLERNRVGINFDINEGRTARIKRISFVGNEKFPDKELRSILVLRRPDLLSWFTKNDQYSKQKLSADLETLRSYYLDRGYLEFNIESTQVSITPDLRDIYITINVTEGAQYSVSDIKVAGETIIPEEEIHKLILLKNGDVFVREKLTESIKLITDRLGDDGYAFANINASPEIDYENRQAAFTFFIDPGKRVYVRRIDIEGNDRTRDEVIRREFRQMEGAWHSTSQINLSKVRVDRLGFFNSVDVETPAVPNKTDQVDIKVRVEERPTGSIMFGAGYSDRQGIILNASISQNNIFGTGNFFSLDANRGAINETYSASFTNPYATVDGVSFGVDAYKRVLDTRALTQFGSFKTDTLGAGFRLGIPIAENDIVSVGLAAENTSIGTFENSPQRYKDFVNEFGTSTNNFPATLSWARDRRDSAIWPTSGTTHRLFGEVSVPGGDLNYYKVSYNQKWYFPITDFFTLLINTEFGYGDGYRGKSLPFFKNFFAGGNNSVRGYDLNSLGPRDDTLLPSNVATTTRRLLAVGASKRVVGNIELMFPVPFLRDDRSLRFSVFVDGGTTFNQFSELNNFMRYSTGIALTWISPMGPLKVSLAEPLNDIPADNLQRFQFMFGQQF
ncbi:outer membrane protein assembly factor BamA [Nitrosomonas ureae]|uniref:Outer membrane protein assembly factor BamA n=1 Tax=Nitrosomonas ureae TaxID=44577 RepID=A0A0S3AH90_9PROT|nr:outer membrane protein assembly factor BamA [Nitrosomonas ureae]ALQ50541.1 outer membrane protein assembly factor BamA [Nitrosomonas ureae]PTQ79548.1 Beta-barrel assembly machine subunit BamA [Nitrosomonas ureae]SDT86474.1 Beta-barrel assembly machine subunit BamA [Nitrosomonas ureae]SEP81234.1 Beta-barrel assembly machine subunit BamA [Nitrosomonas ureae]